MDRVRRAIAEKTAQVNLRVRYRPTEYQVVYGDRAYGIARKTGIPYFLLEEANAGRDLNRLSPGDILNIPSRDATIPYDPVPHKRIIVNLTTQSLVAYESGREVFRWAISSGMSNAPTSPGTFQILNHDPEALGSSYTLCGEQGCGQWRMYWFMGIYEVVPGLMNGFHGAVLLPNGAYLGGGNVGRPYTFGCIMSQDDNARLLYEWAEVGTVVEIISGEYPPQSQLAQQVAWGG
jgi:lipoprotein-anchoring transpeptidase ErfK/SrfK